MLDLFLGQQHLLMYQDRVRLLVHRRSDCKRTGRRGAACSIAGRRLEAGRVAVACLDFAPSHRDRTRGSRRRPTGDGGRASLDSKGTQK